MTLETMIGIAIAVAAVGFIAYKKMNKKKK